MTYIYRILIVLVLSPILLPAAQAELSDKQAQALEQTKELLKSAQKRNAYIKDNPNAQKADDSIDQLVNSMEQKQKIYEMASEIFEGMAKKNGGDAIKMNNMLQKAMKDPKTFYKNLSKKIQSHIRGLASEIESQNNKVDSP